MALFGDRLTLTIFLLALALLFAVLELVRQRRLAEQFSLLWLGAAVAVVALSLSRSILDKLAFSLGIAYAPSALFLAGFMALMGIMLYFSTVVTRLARENKQAAQRIGLLTRELNALRARLAELEDASDEAAE